MDFRVPFSFLHPENGKEPDSEECKPEFS